MVPRDQPAIALQRVADTFGQDRPDQDQACGGCAAKLKAHIPKRERIPQRHRPTGRAQAHQRGALTTQNGSQHEESTHQRRPRDRRVAPHQDGVQDKAGEGRPQRGAPSEQLDAHGQEQAGDEGHIAAADHDHMAGAGEVELLVQVVGDAGFDAEQHPVGQGCKRLGQPPVEQRFTAGAQAVDEL